MITLVDGKGQLGSILGLLIDKRKLNSEDNIIIYHTWNVLDKSEETQKQCYEKFKNFVDSNQDTKIIFISTYSQKDNYYNHYKQLSEAYLILNHPNGNVIKLPILIGKGICEKFKKNEAEAFGEMELMSVKDAAEKVLEFALSKDKIRSIRVYGDKVSAKLAKDLILFGKA
jgi:hypothetical protein